MNGAEELILETALEMRREKEDEEFERYGDHSYDEDIYCPECDGSGTVVVRASDGRRVTCGLCSGTGEVEASE